MGHWSTSIRKNSITKEINHASKSSDTVFSDTMINMFSAFREILAQSAKHKKNELKLKNLLESKITNIKVVR